MSEELVNFSALEGELQRALEADRKYQRENDAKFRALHQKVGSYEEFRDIVQASHLRPLDKKDKTGGPRKQPWNSVASSSSSFSSSSFTSSDTPSQPHPPPTVLSPECPLPHTLPRTASEMSRSWRQKAASSRGRYRLLLALGGPALRGIFRAEVSSGLLGEILVVLCEGLLPGDEDRVMEVLEGLTQTPRFSLNLALLSPSERRAAERLLPLLATAGQRSSPHHALHDRGERARKGEVGGEEEEEGGGEEPRRGDAEEQGGVPGGGGSDGEIGREEERTGSQEERTGGLEERGEEEKRGSEEEERGRKEGCCSETTEGYRDTEESNQRISDLMQLYGVQPDSTQQ